jgi:hypothetical protein
VCQLKDSGLSESVWESDDGDRLAIDRIGALQRVPRPATFPTGDLRGILYALRLRIENAGGRAASFEGVRLQVVSAAAAVASAELLVELERLEPGERVDGWLVFELSDGAQPLRVEECGPGRSGSVWQVDITDPIEDRDVYRGRSDGALAARMSPPQ